MAAQHPSGIHGTNSELENTYVDKERRYLIQTKLGSGNQAVMYECEDLHYHHDPGPELEGAMKVVAVKKIRFNAPLGRALNTEQCLQ